MCQSIWEETISKAKSISNCVVNMEKVCNLMFKVALEHIRSNRSCQPDFAILDSNTRKLGAAVRVVPTVGGGCWTCLNCTVRKKVYISIIMYTNYLIYCLFSQNTLIGKYRKI